MLFVHVLAWLYRQESALHELEGKHNMMLEKLHSVKFGQAAHAKVHINRCTYRTERVYKTCINI